MRPFALVAALFLSLSPLVPPAPSAAPTPAAPRVIRFLVDPNSPPFAFLGDGRLRGFDIDLGEALAASLGAEAQWLQEPFDVAVYSKMLEEGRADAVLAAMSITERRAYFVDFSRPYFTTRLAVAARPGFSWDPREFARGFRGGVMGVMRGTTGERWARRNLSCEIKLYDSIESLLRGLNPGGNLSDAVLIDQHILVTAASGPDPALRIVEKDIGREDYGIAVRKGNRKLANELDGALDRLEASGDYARIYGDWFGVRTPSGN